MRKIAETYLHVIHYAVDRSTGKNVQGILLESYR